MQDLNSIIAKYSATALGSRSPLHKQQKHMLFPPKAPKDGHSSGPTSSSHGLYPSSKDPRNFTHSGYLTRKQLFGRSPAPDVTEKSSSRSTHLESLHARSRSSLAPPVTDKFPAKRQLEDHRRPKEYTSTHRVRFQQSLRSNPAGLRSPCHTDRSSGSRLREKYTACPPDEWIEAGTTKYSPKIIPISSSSKPKINSASASSTQRLVAQNEQSSEPAMTPVATRGILKVANPVIKNVWRSKSSKIGAHVNRESLESRTPKHRDQCHCLAKLSPHATLREIIVKPRSYGASSVLKSLSHTDTHFMGREATKQQEGVRFTGADFQDVKTLELGDNKKDLHGAQVSSLSIVTLSKVAACSLENLPAKPCAPQMCSLSQVHEVFSQHPVGSMSKPLFSTTHTGMASFSIMNLQESLMPTVVIFNEAPTLSSNESDIAPPTDNPPHSTGKPNKQIFIRIVECIASKTLIVPPKHRDMAFTSLNAITCGYMLFTAIFAAMINTDDKVRTEGLAYHFSIAFLFGFAFCSMMQSVQSCYFRRFPKSCCTEREDSRVDIWYYGEESPLQSNIVGGAGI